MKQPAILIRQLIFKRCVDPRGILMSTAAIAIIGGNDIEVVVAASTVQFE